MSRAYHLGRRFLPAAVLLTIFATLPFLATPSWAQADEAVPTKLERKINVMEKVINEILRESPSWLVGGGGDYTRSLYLEEFGVIFSFDASLVERFGSSWVNFDGLQWLEQLDKIRVETEGDKVIVWRDKDADDEKDASKKGDEDEDANLTLEQLRDKRRASQERRYEAGKQELIDALLDYGDTLSDLNDRQSVALVAYLEKDDYFEREDFSRLIVRAKAGDLRAMADGKLSREEMTKRVRVEEY